MPTLISIAEFQRQFGVSRATVYRLRARGELPLLKVGRSVRIRMSDANKWLNSLNDPTEGQKQS